MPWHIKSTGTIAEIQAELNALVVESEIEEQQFETVKEVFNNSVGEGTTTAQSVVPNTFLEGVFPADNSKLQLIASGYMNGRVSVVNYTLEVVKLNAAGEIIGTVSSSAFNTTTITQGGGGGEGDGLIFGPDPETADSIAGDSDLFFDPWSGSNYTELSFGNPVTVTNGISISGGSVMTSLEFRLLETVGSDFNIGGSALEVVLFPRLITVNGSFSISGDNVVNLDFPLLQTVTGEFLMEASNTTLESVSAPVLESVGDFVVQGNSILNTLNLPLLETVDNEFDCQNCESLTSLSLTFLVTVGSDFSCSGCTVLATFSAPSWIPTDGSGISFFGCALTAASVEGILRRCVLAGVTTSSIDLSGGTNAGTASLNAQGQADVATLGLQVTMNA